MLPMGEPRARAPGLAVRRTGSGGIERSTMARVRGRPRWTLRRRPTAAGAVLGRRAQGVHESQDSLEVLWCCVPAARWAPGGGADAGAGAPGVEHLGGVERLGWYAARLRRPWDAGPVKKSLSGHILAEKGAWRKRSRKPRGTRGGPWRPPPELHASAMEGWRLPGRDGRARVSRLRRRPTHPSPNPARLSSTRPRSSPAWRTISSSRALVPLSHATQIRPGSAMERARAGSRARSSPADRAKNSTTSRPVWAVTRNSTPSGRGLRRTTNPGGGFTTETLDPGRMPSRLQRLTRWSPPGSRGPARWVAPG